MLKVISTWLLYEMISAGGQTKFVTTTLTDGTSASVSLQRSTTWNLTHTEQVTRAETLWCLKVASGNFSCSSCDGLSDIFQTMFPNDPVSKDISLSSSKVSYIISHGLDPYFHNILIDDIKKSSSFYTLEVDETTTEQMKKQFDMHVRFWSETADMVSVRFLGASFLGHAYAIKLQEEIENALSKDGISLRNLIMLSSDGPNVNKALFTSLNDACKLTGSSGLVDIGTCSIHKVHNAFGEALSATLWETDSIIIDIYQWFKLSAARREDYKEIQKILDIPEHTFLRYVQCRWLSLLPALQRVLEQWDGLTEYFLKYLIEKQPEACKVERYKRLSQFFTSTASKPRLLFLVNAALLFQGFLTLFQTEGPLIHLLYDRLVELYKEVLMKFIKEENWKHLNGKHILDEKITKAENELADDKLDIGYETKEAIKKLTPAVQKLFYADVRKFLRALSHKLGKTLPISNSLLRDLQALHPLMRTQSSKQ
jgi:hypothetical protein